MKTYKQIPVAILVSVICLSALILIGCDVASVPGRFTYIVKYEVTANAPATVDIEYIDELNISTPVGGQAVDAATPWIYEFPAAFTYAYDAPFYAYLKIDATSLPNLGDKVTLKIIWKDYRVDFQEEVLIYGELENTGSPPTDPVELYSPELPRQ